MRGKRGPVDDRGQGAGGGPGSVLSARGQHAMSGGQEWLLLGTVMPSGSWWSRSAEVRGKGGGGSAKEGQGGESEKIGEALERRENRRGAYCFQSAGDISSGPRHSGSP